MQKKRILLRIFFAYLTFIFHQITKRDNPLMLHKIKRWIFFCPVYLNKKIYFDFVDSITSTWLSERNKLIIQLFFAGVVTQFVSWFDSQAETLVLKFRQR